MRRILISFSFCLFFLNSICSQTVKIGEQIWMNKNLDVTHFRNGDTIIESQNIEEWYQALRDKKPAWCYYEFKDENGKRLVKINNQLGAIMLMILKLERSMENYIIGMPLSTPED